MIRLILLLPLMTACSFKAQPKAYVCVEKPPLKVTYIDYDRDIATNTVDAIIRHATIVPYKACKLNDRNEVVISYDVKANHTSNSSTDINLD